MKKTYKIDVDCANCANKMEDATKKTPGVKDATVNFMTLKMNVEFEEGADVKAVIPSCLAASREPNCLSNQPCFTSAKLAGTRLRGRPKRTPRIFAAAIPSFWR